MNMILPDEGKQQWLDLLFLHSADGTTPTLAFRLYTVDISLTDATVLADFTQATFTGYTHLEIDRGDFGAASIVSHVAVAIYGTPLQFTCTGGSPQTVYGWYCEALDAGVCLAAQKFDTARVMSVGSIEALDPTQFKLKTLA